MAVCWLHILDHVFELVETLDEDEKSKKMRPCVCVYEEKEKNETNKF